jgi:hypothetical protein
VSISAAVGFPYLTAYIIFYVLCNFFSMRACIFLSVRIAKSRFDGPDWSQVFTVWHLQAGSDLHPQESLGEMQVLIFLPLVLWDCSIF